MKDKGSFREHFLRLLKEQGSTQRAFKSRRIAKLLFDLPVFQKAAVVLFYASLPSEVETFAMMRQAIESGKKVALPVIAKDQQLMAAVHVESFEALQQGPYGIMQPQTREENTLDPCSLDAVVVPGLGFDANNNRLGRGAGYYDRFLSALPQSAATIGLAFDFQIVPALPVEPHDVALDHVIAA